MRGVTDTLSKTCSGRDGMCSNDMQHASCTGKRAAQAAIYPLQLCKAILQGIRLHLEKEGLLHAGCVGVMTAAEEQTDEHYDYVTTAYSNPEVYAAEGYERRKSRNQGTHNGHRTYDALTKQLLDEELVELGKAAEMNFLRQWTVYEYATYEEAWAETGKKPISTRWVCTNKGDDLNPNIRCRWVAREFRDDQDVIFAATAPYESIRLLLSAAAAKEETTHKGKIGGERLQIALIDVKRAYFNAHVAEDMPICVELPPEDPEHGRLCGRLRRHLYGTRGAAAGWEDEYASFMIEVGFKRGVASGCLFHHPGRDLRVVVYGDDFTIVGSCVDIDWFQAEMEGRYAITNRGRLGSDKKG